MSRPSFGLRCQAGLRSGRDDPMTSPCRAEISGAASERDLFHAAATFGFARVSRVWLCPACKPADPARLAIVKPARISENPPTRLDPKC